METIRNINDHKVLVIENGKKRVVAENLGWIDARDISTSLNALGISSCYTSWSNIF